MCIGLRGSCNVDLPVSFPTYGRAAARTGSGRRGTPGRGRRVVGRPADQACCRPAAPVSWHLVRRLTAWRAGLRLVEAPAAGRPPVGRGSEFRRRRDGPPGRASIRETGTSSAQYSPAAGLGDVPPAHSPRRQLGQLLVEGERAGLERGLQPRASAKRGGAVPACSVYLKEPLCRLCGARQAFSPVAAGTQRGRTSRRSGQGADADRPDRPGSMPARTVDTAAAVLTPVHDGSLVGCAALGRDVTTRRDVTSSACRTPAGPSSCTAAELPAKTTRRRTRNRPIPARPEAPR